MRAVDVIRCKRDGGTLSPAMIDAFIQAATHGHWADYQLAALLMAIWLRGMSPSETAHLTKAMVDSGRRLDWSDLGGPCVDKHSTGGVGDKTSLILAPLAAACGARIPMMSGRGLGHTGGTLDKLESIPGFRVGLSIAETRRVLAEVGVVLIGQTQDVAPADRKLYALRDVTATVESIPLITASILSKKIAEGIDGLVMDVKFGRGAFMKSQADAYALARSIASVGQANGVRTIALLTDMNIPLGRTIGNALEVMESVAVLRGTGPRELTDLSILLAAHLVHLAGITDTLSTAEARVRAAIADGSGLRKFREIIAAQGGNPEVVDNFALLPTAPDCCVVFADRSGYIADLNAEMLGIAAMRLGAGRDRAEDAVDHAVGIRLLVEYGDQVTAGAPIMELHFREPERRDAALHELTDAVRIADAPPPARTLVLDTLDGASGGA